MTDFTPEQHVKAIYALLRQQVRTVGDYRRADHVDGLGARGREYLDTATADLPDDLELARVRPLWGQDVSAYPYFADAYDHMRRRALKAERDLLLVLRRHLGLSSREDSDRLLKALRSAEAHAAYKRQRDRISRV